MEDKTIKHLWTICIPSKCPHLDKHSYKNYCCKEDELGNNPSKELMLDCALRYYWERADELERLRKIHKNE